MSLPITASILGPSYLNSVTKKYSPFTMASIEVPASLWDRILLLRQLADLHRTEVSVVGRCIGMVAQWEMRDGNSPPLNLEGICSFIEYAGRGEKARFIHWGRLQIALEHFPEDNVHVSQIMSAPSKPPFRAETQIGFLLG